MTDPPGVREQRCRQEIANSTSKLPIDRFRYKCMMRNASGIKGIGRMFRLFDDDGNRALNFEEFQEGILERCPNMKPHEIKELFQDFDRDGSGCVTYNEFLKELRPPMNQRRIRLIEAAFNKLNKTGDSVITVDDLKDVYSVREHPKFKNGEWNQTQCLRAFLDSFDISDHPDGQVTKEEFINYYSGVSMSIDDDAYFDLMMRNAWQL